MERERTEGSGLLAAHDLVIRSEIALPGLRPCALGVADRTADLEVSLGGAAGVDRRTDETVVARDRSEGRELTVVRAHDGGLHLCGEGLEMAIDLAGSAIVASSEPHRSGSLGWWVGGLGLAAVLLQRGHLVMHGSLVSHRGRGLLFMAASGHGKSVTAAAACAAGSLLVADDTVRIDRVADNPPSDPAVSFSAPTGSQVLRTRRTHQEMVSMFPTREVYESSDGRVAVEPAATPGRSSLDRLVFLKLDPDATEARVDEVDPMTALTAGLGHLRVPGLVDAQLTASCFDQLAALADAVPARVFNLPWNGSLRAFGGHVAHCLETC